MEIDIMLRDLAREWRRVKRTISRLEAQQKTIAVAVPRRRGRKSMGRDERLEVSRRMREYWRLKRAQPAEHAAHKESQ